MPSTLPFQFLHNPRCFTNPQHIYYLHIHPLSLNLYSNIDSKLEASDFSHCSKMIKLGRNGMPGSTWDESGKTEIVQILISHQQNGINSIRFLYCIEGEAVLSESHGEPNGLRFNTVVLDRPLEFLTSIRGEYEEFGRLVSIVFCTNKANYGPFGRTRGLMITESFNYEFAPMCGDQQKCCFGGFHGSVVDGYVNAIGVYIKPLELAEQSGFDDL